MSLCLCVCVTVWAMRVCARQCVSKERLPFKVRSVCGRGGGTLSHSAGGKLLSFSFGSSIICISCHPPFSFFSCRLRSRTETAGSSSSEGVGENQNPPPPPPPPACLQAQPRSKDSGAVQRRLCCYESRERLSLKWNAACL